MNGRKHFALSQATVQIVAAVLTLRTVPSKRKKPVGVIPVTAVVTELQYAPAAVSRFAAAEVG
jgi:hypothetical protein